MLCGLELNPFAPHCGSSSRGRLFPASGRLGDVSAPLLGKGQALADLYLPVRVNGYVATIMAKTRPFLRISWAM
jgi:hypothetical protein